MRKLGRTTSHRKAMLSNLVTSLFHYERITTTLFKAKEARRLAERLITKAKKDTLSSRRQVAKVIKDKEALRKLFSSIAPRFKERPGGYTRILKMGRRKGDNAHLAIIELTERITPPARKEKIKEKPKEVRPKVEKPPLVEKKVPFFKRWFRIIRKGEPR